MKPRPLADRFWEKVNKTNTCWEWTGSLGSSGYGQMFGTHKHPPLRAHRLSWEIHNGPIPKGSSVLHRCDNPKCVRPDHLFLGDQTKNMDDMTKKGRRFRKIPEEAVRAIKAGEMSGKKAAELFGVHPRYPELIVNGVCWKEVQ